MALPSYDSAKHHVGLGTVGGTSFGLMLAPGYVRDMQREGIGAPDLGGATDLIGQIPSLSRLTQDDFVGGMFGYHWGRDDAMFADCTGFITGAQSRSLFSCPPMFLKKAYDPDGQPVPPTGDAPKSMFMVGGSIYLVFPTTIVRYQIDTDTTSTLNIGDTSIPDTDYRWVNGEYNSVDQVIWLLAYDSTKAGLPRIDRIKTDLSGNAAFDPWYTGPTGTARLQPFGFTIFNGTLLCQLGRKLFVGDPPDDPSPAADDDDVTWTKKGVLLGRWRDSIPYNGVLYILTNDGSFKSNVYAWDGDDILPICTLPFNFYAKCITEYAGRIYVGGTGTDVNGGEHYAELYEITGASVRLVRSFSPETRHQFLGGLAGEWPRAFDDLAVFEGMLWMCQKGKRLIAYDITSDGFTGAAEIQSNADLNFTRMVTGRGRLWCWGVDDSDDTKHGIYRIAQPADTISAWKPTLVTSDVIYEPGMDKRWSEIKVMSKYGPVDSLEYSVDGGETFTALSTTVTSTGSKVYFAAASLAAISPSRLIRFRIKLDEDTPQDARTYHRELIAWTLSFAMLDTGKWAWGFTVLGASEIETRDALLTEATTQAYAPEDIRSTLSGWAKNKTPLTFRDLDDEDYSVHIVGYREVQPVIGPDITTEPEAQFSLTLVEV